MRKGDKGKIYYYYLTIGKEEKVSTAYVAKFKVKQVSKDSSMAKMRRLKEEVWVGHFVEIIHQEDLKKEKIIIIGLRFCLWIITVNGISYCRWS